MAKDNSPSIKFKERHGHTQLESVDLAIKYVNAIEDESTDKRVREHAAYADSELKGLRNVLRLSSQR